MNSNCFNSYPGQGKTAQISKDHPASLALETWLSEQETIYRYLVYEADPDWTPWTQRCIRNADRILILGWAEGEPKLSEIEHRMEQMAPLAPRELVLLHPKMTARPRETRQWLAGRQVQTHHHIRLNHVGDLQRLARQLTGHAVGLVLGGGVARALAHIGVIRAIREACLPVDIIGGTSLGAIVAAAYALGWDYETMVQAAKTFITPRQIFDPTLPLVSLANSHKASKTLAAQFDGVQIEDLWLPFFCISSNLTRARPEIQRQGALWKHLRASCSLPGIFTPVVEAGDLLVDGALMNNLPVDVMRDLCQNGPVIAVDVGAETDLSADYQFRASLSGWEVLWSKLNPFSPEIKVPGLFDTLRRSIELNGVHQKQANKALADLCINPPVAQFGSGEFEAYETLIEVGYQSAQAAIGTWLNKQMEIWNQKYRPGLAD